MISRRGLLKKTLGGAAVLAAASAVPLALRRTQLRAPRTKLQFFTPAEYSIWAAVADRILGREPTAATQEHYDGPGLPNVIAIEQQGKRAAPPTPAELDLAGKADAFLAPLPPSDAKDLKQLLALFDNALFNFLAGGAAKPFTQQNMYEQDDQLAAWQGSRLAIQRTGFQAMKRLCCAIYFGSPEVFPSLGYAGPPVELVRSALAAKRAQP